MVEETGINRCGSSEGNERPVVRTYLGVSKKIGNQMLVREGYFFFRATFKIKKNKNKSIYIPATLDAIISGEEIDLFDGVAKFLTNVLDETFHSDEDIEFLGNIFFYFCSRGYLSNMNLYFCFIQMNSKKRNSRSVESNKSILTKSDSLLMK